MAWTAPRTWVTGEIVTASLLNTHLRDNMLTVTPAGAILGYGNSAAPSGWLACDGTAVSRTTYSALFAAISTQYGAGDGSTTFTLPDLRGRVIAGLGAHADVNALTDGDGLAEALRSPKHRHTVTDPGHTHGVEGPVVAAAGAAERRPGNGSGIQSESKTTGISVGPSGSSLDAPAYGVALYIIKT